MEFKFQEFLWIQYVLFDEDFRIYYILVLLFFVMISFLSVRSKKREKRFSSTIKQILYFIINSLSFPFIVICQAFLQDLDRIPSRRLYSIDAIDGFSAFYGQLYFIIIGIILSLIILFISGKIFVLKKPRD